MSLSAGFLVFNDDDEKSVRSGISEIDVAPKAVTSVTITSNSSISNNNSIDRSLHTQDKSDEKNERPTTNHHIKGRSKPNTAPQLFRTPLFSEPPPPESSNSGRGPSPTGGVGNNSVIVPQRPTTGKPPTASSKATRKQQNVNLENRILIKMASVLPTESSNKKYDLTVAAPGINANNFAPTGSPSPAAPLGPGRLPESRTNLLKLNGELDEMIRDSRALSLEYESCNFGMVVDYAHVADETITSNIMENGAIVYDAIIAELTSQAAKKVSRVKRFYRNHIQKMKARHDEELDELKLKLQEVNSKYYELQVTHSTEILRSGSSDVVVDGSAKLSSVEETHVVSELEKILDESSTVPLPRKSQREQIHEYISMRLDEERKVCL